MDSIRFRVILLSTFALVFLGFTIFKGYSDVQNDLKKSQNSLTLINNISYLSQVIHSLQKERGLSAINITNENKLLKKELLKQRQITDSILKDLNKNFNNNLNNKLIKIRENIDTNVNPWYTIKQFYSQKIEHLLNQIHLSIGSLDYSKDIIHKLDAVYNLLYAKENLGLLRATISRYYQKDSLSTQELLDVGKRYFIFKDRYKSFLLEQNNFDAQRFKDEIQTKTFDSIKNQVESVLTNNYIHTDAATLKWWEDTTSIINTMLKVEKELLEQIRKHSNQTITKTQKKLFIYTIFALIAFFMIFLLTILTVSRILQALSCLIRSLNRVQEKEDFEIRIETKSNDEFTKLSSSINNLLDYTAKIIKEKDKLASTDLLTGIMNRRSFTTSANKEIARSHRYKTPLSLIYCDIDKFKSVNDNYGHSMGDQVLEAFAKTVKSHIRDSDLFGRWGGEEFIILAVETDESQAQQLADHLRKLVMDIKVLPSEQVTCSFGVSQLKNNESFEELCERADKAVYHAKNSGRNKVSTNSEATPI
ncbi:diguanylate cyclase [Sulfurimonas lithotrophica]|uniref:diguanylate cyclase n=1 Tax=Sulfurimonas lithotrophica TaxID=2590022 RepID=A0A5P8P3Z8_9BACT|nr:diguanylate cyclase [Sulfurimonas lithotrophica]QFR50260.1 diguanylate cyclase [Sulfurimonas lithotrophica]